jgi:hypothetical protein
LEAQEDEEAVTAAAAAAAMEGVEEAPGGNSGQLKKILECWGMGE